MNNELLQKEWLAEEQAAHIHGWDFSHIDGRYKEEAFPWDYKSIILQYLSPEDRLLDMDTGGGEFLLELHHPYRNTSAIESFPPNVRLCKKTLLPLEIDFREANAQETLPFENDVFDIVINRHGSFNVRELFRIMKPGGIFITEQIGAENDREFVNMLVPGTELPFPNQYLNINSNLFLENKFEILQSQEAFRPIKFYDVGALVWFARILEWEFPDFSVNHCTEHLWRAQERVDRLGCIEGNAHRFLLVAKKSLAK